MQKTTLLVTVKLRIFTMLFVAMMMVPMAAYSQSGPAAASEDTTADGEPAPNPTAGSAAPDTAGSDSAAPDKQWGDSKPPENYVASKAPTKSESPYNYIQMAYGGLVMLVMGCFIVWLIRRNTRDYESTKGI